MRADEQFGFTPLLPTYAEVRLLLPIFVGMPKSFITGFLGAIKDLTGTPQQPLDWSDPDTWIDERLAGDYRDFAARIWEETGREVNPRHMRGSYYFINRQHLLDTDVSGVYTHTSMSRAFLNSDPELFRQLDEAEGLRQLLGIISTKSPAKRADIFPEWADFVRSQSNYNSRRAIESLLRSRRVNLIDRHLIIREGNAYSITERGLEYALPIDKPEQAPDDPRQSVTRAIREYNSAQFVRLRELIGEMPPYQFEHLARDLLEAMGYEDVEVTRQSGDRGVDVVATVQFGITTIREVVQAKRHQGTISRPTIDQLRGALPYYGAIRGTIITTGKFSKGCAEAAIFAGAAPITLIDGERLMELLIEHGIGIEKRSATLYEIDTELFAESSEQDEIEESLIE